MTSVLSRTRLHTVPVPIIDGGDRIESVNLTVVHRSDDLEEIDLDQRAVGYIQQAGRVFVSLTGARADRAEECGQYLVWDQAAAELVRRAKHEQEGQRA